MRYILIYICICLHYISQAKRFNNKIVKSQHDKKRVSSSKTRKKEGKTEHSVLMEDLLKYLQIKNNSVSKKEYKKKTKHVKNKKTNLIAVSGIPVSNLYLKNFTIKNIPEQPIYSNNAENTNPFKRHDLKHPEPKVKIKNNLKSKNKKTRYKGYREEPSFIKEKTFTILSENSKEGNFNSYVNTNTSNNGLINLSGWGSGSKKRPEVHLLRLHRIDFPKLLHDLKKYKIHQAKLKFKKTRNKNLPSIYLSHYNKTQMLLDLPEKYTEFLTKGLVEDLEPEFNRIGDSEFKIGKTEDTDRRLIKLENDDNNLVRLIDVKKGFFKGNKKKNDTSTDVSRKDFIPRPSTLNKENSKRDSLPYSATGYNLPQSQQSFPIQQINEFPAEYPSTFNLRPMNDLYTRSQLLDANEENIVDSYLKSEKVEEDDIKNSNSEVLPLNTDAGELYQGEKNREDSLNMQEDDHPKEGIKEKRRTLLALLRSAIQKKKEDNLKQIQSKLLTLKRLEDSRQQSVYVSTTPNVNKNTTTKVTSLIHLNKQDVTDGNDKKQMELSEAPNKAVTRQSNDKLKHNNNQMKEYVQTAINQENLEDNDKLKSGINYHDVSASKKTTVDYFGMPIPQNSSDYESLEEYYDLKPSTNHGLQLLNLIYKKKESDNQEKIDTSGETRQMNEFKFNGQIKLDPSADPNKIRIVHGPPPSDFAEAFATPFPPMKLTTPFGPFFGKLPSGQVTATPNLPTHKNDNPWAWNKNPNSPTKNARLPLHTHTPTKRPFSITNGHTTKHFTTLKMKNPTNTQPSHVLVLSNNISESKILNDNKNNNFSNSNSESDGEVILSNDDFNARLPENKTENKTIDKSSNQSNRNFSSSFNNSMKLDKDKTQLNNLPIAYVTYEKNKFAPEKEKDEMLLAENKHSFPPKELKSEMKQHIVNEHELKSYKVDHLFGTDKTMETFGKSKDAKITLLNKNVRHHTPHPFEETKSLYLHTPYNDNKKNVKPAINKPFYDYLSSLPTTKITSNTNEKRNHESYIYDINEAPFSGTRSSPFAKHNNLNKLELQKRTKSKDNFLSSLNKFEKFVDNFKPSVRNKDGGFKPSSHVKDDENLRYSGNDQTEKHANGKYDVKPEFYAKHISSKALRGSHSMSADNIKEETSHTPHEGEQKENLNDDVNIFDDNFNDLPASTKHFRTTNKRKKYHSSTSMKLNNRKSSRRPNKLIVRQFDKNIPLSAERYENNHGEKEKEITGKKRTFSSVNNYDSNGDRTDNVIREEEVYNMNNQENAKKKDISPKLISEGLYEMEAKLREALKGDDILSASEPSKKTSFPNFTSSTQSPPTLSMQHEIPTLDLSVKSMLKNVGSVPTSNLNNISAENNAKNNQDLLKVNPTILPLIDMGKSSKYVEDVESFPARVVLDEPREPLKLKLLRENEFVDLVTQRQFDEKSNANDFFNSESDNSHLKDEMKEENLKKITEEKLLSFHKTNDAQSTKLDQINVPTGNSTTTTSQLTTTKSPMTTEHDTLKPTMIVTHRSTKSLVTAGFLVTPPSADSRAIAEAEPPTHKNYVTSTESLGRNEKYIKSTQTPPTTTKPIKATEKVLSHEITTARKPSATNSFVSYPRIKVDVPPQVGMLSKFDTTSALKLKMKPHDFYGNDVNMNENNMQSELSKRPYYAYGIQYSKRGNNTLPSSGPEQYHLSRINTKASANNHKNYTSIENQIKKEITDKPDHTANIGDTKPTFNIHTDTSNETKSPLEQELNLDDMYWTDSADEIENACRKEKGTNLVVNILAFGDSLTRGYYNKGKNHHPYTMKLQYLLNKMDAKRCFIVENEGRDGDVAFGEMPKRMEEVYKEYRKHFDWVIILGGTNDIYNKKHAGHHTAQELTQNILSVHNIAHHYGSKTVAITIPEVLCDSSDVCQDMKQVRETLNENIRRYVNDHRTTVLLCDLADSLARNKIDHKLIGQFFEGGLHLRPRGYELMARLIFDSLQLILD